MFTLGINNEMDLFEDIRTEFILRARLHDDEVSIGLKGHLLSEYLLNRIIDKKLSSSKQKEEITYSKKLKLLEERRLLPVRIINNLRLLNTFRNKLVHELDAQIESKDMIYYKSNRSAMHVKLEKGKHPQRQYLRLLSHGVLTQLINYMLTTLKVDPRWPSKYIL